MFCKALSLTLPFALLACSAGTSTSLPRTDTSGCSQLLGKEASTATQMGRFLEVRSSMPHSDTCWNIETAGYSIRYSWRQEGPQSQLGKVEFWTKSDGREESVAAFITCREIHAINPGHDTSGRTIYECVAEAYVPMGYRGNYQVEIAPVVDGNWDTAGFAQNYRFSL